MEDLFARWGSVADFVTIYIAEAHPRDGWRQDDPRWDVMQPTTTSERMAVAADWIEWLKPNMPYLVDPIEDSARHAFAALPERLYIAEDGEVQYQGGQGPFEYDPQEIEDWLCKRFPERGSAAAIESEIFLARMFEAVAPTRKTAKL